MTTYPVRDMAIEQQNAERLARVETMVSFIADNVIEIKEYNEEKRKAQEVINSIISDRVTEIEKKHVFILGVTSACTFIIAAFTSLASGIFNSGSSNPHPPFPPTH